MEFTYIHTLSNLEPLAAEWNALVAENVTITPFLRYEYLRAWWERRGGGEWPKSELAVILAHDDRRLAGIAPLFFTNNLDNDPALMLLGGIEISDYLDLLVRPADLPAFLSGLLDFLALPGPFAWRALDWYNLPEASPTLSPLRVEAERHGWVFTREPFRPALSVSLPGDFETYLASIDKKQRHEIRRKMRRAAEDGRSIRWYIVEDESVLDAEADALLDLMANDPEKAVFLSESMRAQMHLIVQAAFHSGWLQLSFLEVDGVKAAGYLNFDYHNRIWVYNSGLDRRFMDLSPGWVLLGHLLQWANENKRLEFDFMRGDEEYKSRFGGVRRDVLRVKVSR